MTRPTPDRPPPMVPSAEDRAAGCETKPEAADWVYVCRERMVNHLKAAYRDGWNAALATEKMFGDKTALEAKQRECDRLVEALASPRAPATGEDRRAARIAIAKVLSPQRWSNLNAGEESRELAAAENLLAAQIAAAHASGVRAERKRNAEVRHAAATFLAITGTANINEALTRDNIAWGLRHNLRRALAAPEPQEEKHDG